MKKSNEITNKLSNLKSHRKVEKITRIIKMMTNISNPTSSACSADGSELKKYAL